MTIVKFRLRFSAESEHDMSHNVSALDLRILKCRITISVFAVLDVKVHEFLLNSIVTIHLTDHILHLNAIGADILDCRSTDFARDVRKIFHTPESFLRCPLTEIVKDYSGTDRNQDLSRRLLRWSLLVEMRFLTTLRVTVGTFLAILQDFNEINLRVKNSSLEVVSKKKIAAATDMENRTGQFLKIDINKVRHRVILHKAPCLHLHSEGVHLRQILIVFCFYHREAFLQNTDNQRFVYGRVGKNDHPRTFKSFILN